MSTRIILLLSTLLVTSSFMTSKRERAMSIGHQKQSSTSLDKIPTVSFCDLVAHPELYDNKTVRARASYIANFEGDMLYDLGCDGKENYIWPILDCDTDESCEILRETLNKKLTGDPFSGMRAELVIIGRLKSSKSGERYGIQNGFRLWFAITRIEQVNPVPPNAPLPRPNNE